jgi:hypothetical protein
VEFSLQLLEEEEEGEKERERKKEEETNFCLRRFAEKREKAGRIFLLWTTPDLAYLPMGKKRWKISRYGMNLEAEIGGRITI